MAGFILPKGFKVSGIHCGIKKRNKDLALIYSESPCKAAGVFTKNRVKAAPVLITKKILSNGNPIHAVIINSGNANCCTGKAGLKDARRMVYAVSDNLGLSYGNVCVSSTGIIGRRLPIETIISAVAKVVRKLSEKSIIAMARAILTTDKKRKIETVRFTVGNKEVVVTGVCKGAGMVHPNMATMLCYIMTDALIDKDILRAALKKSVDKSFNVISVDGDMSTNDSVLLLANGLAGNRLIRKGTSGYLSFTQALDKLTLKLAKDIVIDGERATKFVPIHVHGARTTRDADTVARTIANSALVKTSIYGGDGNWGRIAGRVGASLIAGINQNKMEIFLDGVCMFRKGQHTNPSSTRIAKIYKRVNVEIRVKLHAGRKNAVMYTCDLSKRYIEINAHYST